MTHLYRDVKSQFININYLSLSIIYKKKIKIKWFPDNIIFFVNKCMNIFLNGIFNEIN